ncbi:MAG: TetR family transcriptional regulator [Solirubrobacterales bacterium]|jgi:DNA-binding transcriptional regulator YbjK|nr:TetR family transcriptional regulator [Solirubrobacterales bacterium]
MARSADGGTRGARHLSPERPPRGEARRAHILEAALRIVGTTGPEALTHRRVAEAAGLPLAATTYWFASKEELVAEAYALAAARDVARIGTIAAALERDGLETGEDLAGRLAALAAQELHGERAGLIASYALWLEAARRPALRDIARGWTDAYLGLAAAMMAAAGSTRAEGDAQLLVAALDGLLLEQLARDEPDFEAQVLRPALERLIAALLA